MQKPIGIGGMTGVFLNVVVLLGIWFGAISLTAQVSGKGQILDVDVLVLSPGGKPVEHLTATDFVPSEQNEALPLTVMRPVLGDKNPPTKFVSTWMLIVLTKGPGSSPATLGKLSAALTPVWERGWRVSIVRSDGSSTGYARTAEQLEQMLAAPAGPPMGVTVAMQDLKLLSGRHIVLYQADSMNQQALPPNQLLQRARNAMAEMFVVDGGAPGDPLEVPAAGEPNRAERAAGDAGINAATGRAGGAMQGWPKRVFEGDSGLYLEVNAKCAVRDAIHNALGYYELRIRAPSLMPNGAGSVLSIQIKQGPDMIVSGHVRPAANAPTLRITLGK
jgi:hypothetical protein